MSFNSNDSLPPWLSEHHQSMMQQFTAGSLSHAILLSGDYGIGKALLAEQAARAMLCKANDSLACGECHSCKLAQAQTHPDLMHISPEEGKKIISVDQIRALMKEVYSTPQICESKVILISPADRLNHNAANALLKCLEEPPSNTYFLLCTAFMSRLPATVRSRCRIGRIAGPNHENSIAWLESQGLSKADSEARLAVCSGRPLAALEEGAEILARHVAIRKAIDSVAGSLAPVSQLASSLQAFDLAALLPTYLIELVALSKQAVEKNRSDPGDSTIWSTKALLGHASVVQKMIASIEAGSILNAQLATEDMLLNLQKCRQQ